MSFTGTLLAESMRTDAVLDHVPLSVHRIWRSNAGDVSAGQPLTWTFIEFEVPETSAGQLAEHLSAALAPGPWYCDFRNAHESIVVFSGKVFRYARGNQRTRDETEAHARSVGVPEAQIDWPA